jgi:hypothetical protein
VAEVRPDANEGDIGVHLGLVPLDVVEKFGGLQRILAKAVQVAGEGAYGEECIRNIHAHVDGVPNDREVEEVTPTVGGMRCRRRPRTTRELTQQARE